MKYLLLFCITSICWINTYSQKFKQSIGFYTNALNIRLPFTIVGGAAVSEHVFLLGTEYSRHLGKWLHINGGIEFSDHSVAITTDNMAGYTTTRGHVQLASIPIYFQADILRFLYVTFGTVIDCQLKNNIIKPQRGIGITGGTGFKFDLKDKTTVFIHPFYQLHGDVRSNIFQDEGAHLINIGIRAGFNYRF